MSESTLSLTYDDILSRMALEPGNWGADSANWSAKQLAQLQRSMADGLREFYESFDWSFLYPAATLTIWPTTTGTASGTPSTTLTATTAIFYPTMVGKTITVGSGSYTIASYTSSTVVTLTATAVSEGSGPTITITSDGNYRLPDDFAYVYGKFTYQTQETLIGGPLSEVNEQQIRAIRQSAEYTGRPDKYAIRALSHNGTSGQRFELMVNPYTDGVYTWDYTYAVLPDAITSSAPYPYGGAAYASCIIAFCRAQLEFDLQGMRGEHFAERERQFARAVQIESRKRPDTVGYNSNGAGNLGADSRPYMRVANTFSINGTEI